MIVVYLLSGFVAAVLLWSVYRLMVQRAAKAARESLDLAQRSAVAELNALNVERALQNEDTARFNAQLDSRLRELQIGDRLKYRLGDGSDVWITIKSERLKNETGVWGWEALFEDDGQIGFADERRVVASGLVVAS